MVLRRLLADSAIYGASDLVFKVIALAVFPIYARAFTVEEFGVMTLVTTVSGVAAIIQELGLNSAVQRYYWDPQTTEERRPLVVSTGLWLLTLSSSVVTAAVVGMACLAGGFLLRRYQVDWYLVALSALSTVPSQLIQYAQNLLRLKFSPWRFAILSGARYCISTGLTVALIVHYHQGLPGFFYGSLWGLLGAVPIAIWFVRGDLLPKLNLPIGRQLVRFGYPYIFMGLGYWIFVSADRIMLAEFSNNTEVGLFGIAQKFAFFMVLLNTAIGQAWSPVAMKIYAEDENYREVFARMFSYLCVGLVAAGVVVCLFSKDVLYWTTPRSYWPAANPLCVLAVAQILAGTTQITALGIALEGKTRLFATAAWATGALNIFLNWLLIPQWGALGAACASLLSYAVLTGLYLYWTQTLHPLPLRFTEPAVATVVLVATLVVTFYLNSLGADRQMALLSSKIAVSVVLLFGVGLHFRARRRLEN